MSHFLVRTSVLVVLVAAACGGEITPTGPGPATVLTLPATVTGLSGVRRSETLFKFAVPAGKTRLDVVTTGGIGDVDLYLRYHQEPTPVFSDCRPNENGNTTETCSMVDPDEGEWYIMLVGYTAYSGVTLTVSVTP